jgi:hypothetical protein
MEGSDRGLIKLLSRYLHGGAEESHENRQSGRPLYRHVQLKLSTAFFLRAGFCCLYPPGEFCSFPE